MASPSAHKSLTLDMLPFKRDVVFNSSPSIAAAKARECDVEHRIFTPIPRQPLFSDALRCITQENFLIIQGIVRNLRYIYGIFKLTPCNCLYLLTYNPLGTLHAQSQNIISNRLIIRTRYIPDIPANDITNFFFVRNERKLVTLTQLLVSRDRVTKT